MTKGERSELLLLLVGPQPAYRTHRDHGRLRVQNRIVFNHSWAAYAPSQLSITVDTPLTVRAAAVVLAERVEIANAGRRAVLACARGHASDEARLACRRCGGTGYDPAALAAAAAAQSPVVAGQRRLSANGDEEVLVGRALPRDEHPDVVGHDVQRPGAGVGWLSYADDLIAGRWPVLL